MTRGQKMPLKQKRVRKSVPTSREGLLSGYGITDEIFCVFLYFSNFLQQAWTDFVIRQKQEMSQTLFISVILK